ncbi:MAG: arsenic efflux protein [Alistipes sp.]|nr:arsenic efflux protein [Candidatus Minthomonas equi]
MITEIILDSLRNAIMITGLVIVMMMIIELVNVRSTGRWFSSLGHSRFGQTLCGAFLGVIPGCMGGFAAVSLYSHGIISFGALVACMVCSSGDESFVMMAMFPGKALLLFGILFVLSIPFGILTDFIKDRFFPHSSCGNTSDSCSHTFELHEEAVHESKPSIFSASSYRTMLHPSRFRIIITAALLAYSAAIFSGTLEHSHDHHGECPHDEHTEHCTECHCEETHAHHTINLLDERWMNVMFGVLTLLTILFVITADEHFIREHLWGHVIKSHCLRIFLWTFGTLIFIQFLLQHIDLNILAGKNIYIIIMIAALIGIIPESGPHLVFVTLFATGVLPFSVLLASSISQDGHTALPLLASTKKGFASAKVINAVIAIVIGCLTQFILG